MQEGVPVGGRECVREGGSASGREGVCEGVSECQWEGGSA